MAPTQIQSLRALFDKFGLEHMIQDNGPQEVLVCSQGMRKVTGHHGLRVQFLFDNKGSFESVEVIDEHPEAPC